MLRDLHRLSISQCATLACALEVTSPKPGNVYPGADFDGLTLSDFLASAVAIGPAMEQAPRRSVGATVLAAVHATRAVVDTNTNLGTLLLISPLAKVGDRLPLDSQAVRGVLDTLTERDSAAVYQAIQLAAPGGLGRAEKFDVQGEPPRDLRDAMQSAASRDLVARQYVNGFEQVCDEAAVWLQATHASGADLQATIVRTHVRLMAAYPDSLIGRKCGTAIAEEAAHRAADVLAQGTIGDPNYAQALGELDAWLRDDGNRKNPGTTADLVAAGLFVALRNGMLDGQT